MLMYPIIHSLYSKITLRCLHTVSAGFVPFIIQSSVNDYCTFSLGTHELHKAEQARHIQNHTFDNILFDVVHVKHVTLLYIKSNIHVPGIGCSFHAFIARVVPTCATLIVNHVTQNFPWLQSISMSPLSFN